MSLHTKCITRRLQPNKARQSSSREVDCPSVLIYCDAHDTPFIRLTSVLSMNAAISSSVVLASRLSDDLAFFALILFSVQAFALFPMLRQRLQVARYSHCPALVSSINGRSRQRFCRRSLPSQCQC